MRKSCINKIFYIEFLNQAHAAARALFLGIDLVHEVCVCVCVSVCPPPSLVLTSGVIWRDMDPYDWLNKYYSFCMAGIVGIVSRHGFRIEACHRNQANKSKLVLYKLLCCLYSHLKQPYISNRTKRFSYKGRRGMRGSTLIEAFKRRVGLGYI